MLNHWTWRQAAGLVPFCFRKAAEVTLQNGHASEENNADTDMGSGDVAEDDLQDDCGSEVRGDVALQGDDGSNGSTEQANPGQSSGGAAENPSEVGWL